MKAFAIRCSAVQCAHNRETCALSSAVFSSGWCAESESGREQRPRLRLHRGGGRQPGQQIKNINTLSLNKCVSWRMVNYRCFGDLCERLACCVQAWRWTGLAGSGTSGVAASVSPGCGAGQQAAAVQAAALHTTVTGQLAQQTNPSQQLQPTQGLNYAQVCLIESSLVYCDGSYLFSPLSSVCFLFSLKGSLVSWCGDLEQTVAQQF